MPYFVTLENYKDDILWDRPEMFDYYSEAEHYIKTYPYKIPDNHEFRIYEGILDAP